jgi:hypothetical protein
MAALQLFAKDGAQWGGIDQENGRLEIEIDPNEGGKSWRFRLADIERIICTAKEQLASEH